MRLPEFKIKRSPEKLSPPAISFLEKIFYKEQSIPKELIPLDPYNYKWWYIEKGNDIVGIVAAWQIKSEWYWGRLAIHKELRGFGIGKKMMLRSLNEIFQLGIDKVKIDARDITVKMILKIGGRIIGETTQFYGTPITPMVILKKDFISLDEEIGDQYLLYIKERN